MTPDTLTIAVAQTAATPESHDEALDLVRRLADAAPDADLLVLPELALTGYGDGDRIRRLATPLGSPFVDALRDLARDRQTALIVGHAERQADGGLANVALAIGADGVILTCYRKVNLWGPHERSLFASGRPSEVFRVGAFGLGLLICYDLEFPEAARDLVLRGADTLVVISATGRSYPVVPRALVPARGYETGCHVVYADRCGRDGAFEFVGGSRVTAPDGAVLAAASETDEVVISATISRRTVDAWRAGHDYVGDRRSGLYRS